MPNDRSEMTIVVCQHTFYISKKFEAGHIISEDEAYALNQVLMENIRNNVRPMVSKIAGEKGFLDETEQSILQEKINQYVQEYRFRSRSKPRSRSALETAIDDLALERAELVAQKEGIVEPSKIHGLFNHYRSSYDIIEAAKELVLKRRLAVEAATEDLF